MLRILIADDHAIMREGLKQLFQLVAGIQVAAEAATGGQVLDLLRNVEIDLVLLDLSMPGISGASLVSRIRSHDNAPPILILTAHNEVQVARRLLKAGVSGFLTKDADPKTLVSAIFRVAGGGRYIDPRLAEQMLFEVGDASTSMPHERLSDRELEILQSLAHGSSVNDIADELSISNKTVSTHKARLMLKMGFANNAQLVRYAISHRLIET
jgi:DNA-binding NarL/FixJ family response regulator